MKFKAMTAIAVTALFLLTALGATVNAQTANAASTQSFSFPYSYGTPQVPSDVGAQGHVGPTVPNSSIGITVPLSGIGAQGHVGPVNITTNGYFPIVNSTVTITVHNGTTSSSVLAVGVSVFLENLTFDTFYHGGVTSSSGVVTLTVPEGWVEIGANASTTVFTNFLSSVHITSSSASYSVYLYPSTESVKAVDNPSASSGDVWYTTGPDLGNYNTLSIPGLTVELLNESNSGAVLTTAYTMNNGSVEFTNVNTAYNYALFTMGSLASALTGWNYNMSNSTSSTFIFGSKTILSLISTSGGENSAGAGPLSPQWSSTATITGTVFPSRFSHNWSLSSNTVVKNGTVYLGTVITNGYSIEFVNDLIYYQTSNDLINSVVHIVNSSLFGIALILNGNTQLSYYTNGLVADHSWIALYGYQLCEPESINNSYIELPHANALSIISAIPVLTPGSYINDIIINSIFGFVPLTFAHDTVINSSIGTRLSVSAKSFLNSNFANISYTITNAYSVLNYGGQRANHTTFYDDVFNGITYGLYSNSLSATNVTSGGVSVVVSNCNYSGILPSFTTPTGLIPNIDYLNLTFSSFNPSTGNTTDFYANHTFINNDLFVNRMMPFDFLESHKQTSNYEGYFPSIAVVRNAILSYNYVNWSSSGNGNNSGFIFGKGSANVTAMHNYFTGLFIAGGFFESYINKLDYSNNTIESSYENSTISDFFNNSYAVPNGMSPIYTYTNHSVMNISYSSFLEILGGKGAPYDIGMIGATTETVNVNHVLFDAKNMYHNSSYFAQPFTAYFMPEYGNIYLNNSYFLNLNNYTKLFAYGPNFYHNSFWPVNIDFNNNHFFVSPYSSEAILPVTAINGNITASTYVNPVNGSSASKLTLSITKNPYMFNAGKTEATDSAGFGGNAYVYAPDVMLSDSQLTISYSNGLVGGPQPNFTWQGYKYTESVEPSYISVGANSTKAPPVDLQFNGQPNTQYAVAMYDHGSLIDYTNVTSNANGVVTFQYNPATMPLDPVFSLTTFNPVITPINSMFTNSELVLTIVAGFAIFVAAAIALGVGQRRTRHRGRKR